MGIFSEIGEGLALASEAPLLAGLGVIALIYPALSWVRKNAAPRLSEQRQARTFQRVLDTARGLNELAELKNLTDEQRASLEAALVENGMGLAAPGAADQIESPTETPNRALAEPPPPPWFFDRIEALVDVGARILVGLFLAGIGGFLSYLAVAITIEGWGTEPVVGTVVNALMLTACGLLPGMRGLEIVAESLGLSLALVEPVKRLLSRIAPPAWLVASIGTVMAYLGPIGLFATMLHWTLTTTQPVDAVEWGFTVTLGLVAVGMSVKAIQKLRILFHIPDAPSAFRSAVSEPPNPSRGCTIA